MLVAQSVPCHTLRSYCNAVKDLRMKNLKTLFCALLIGTSSYVQGHKDVAASFMQAYPVVVPAAVVGIGLVAERFVVGEIIKAKTRPIAQSFVHNPFTTTLIGACSAYIMLKMVPKIAKQLIREPFKKNPLLTTGLCATFLFAPKILKALPFGSASQQQKTQTT